VADDGSRDADDTSAVRSHLYYARNSRSGEAESINLAGCLVAARPFHSSKPGGC